MVSAGNKVSASAVQVAPASVDFGSTGVGKKVSHTVSVTNNSEQTVTLTQASISRDEFSVSGAQFPVSIQSGQKANFTVWFKGNKAGKVNGILNFHGDVGPTDPVILTGTAGSAAPQLDISPSSHDFGNVTVKTVATTALTLTNSGASVLRISNISVKGETFALGRIRLPAKIPAGGTEILDISFLPKTTGNYSGSAAISSDDPDNPTTTVHLTGVAINEAVGKLTAVPAALSFSNVKVGSSASAVSMLKNTGTANVTLSHITLNAAGFSTTGIATPVLLVPGESMALTVKFTPTAAGGRGGVISVVNSQGGITGIGVFGTAIAATQEEKSALTVSPLNINFGNVNTGVSKTQNIQISNPGAVSVTISAVNMTGSGFGLTGLSFPFTLNPGQTSTFSVQFNPKSAGPTAGSLALVSDASTPPSAVSLSGTGMAAASTLSLNPPTINFGSVVAGVTNGKTVQISNPSSTSVTISAANVTGTGFGISGLSLPMTLNAGQTNTFSVQFNPKSAGATVGSLSLVSSASNPPSAISLSGTGAVATSTLSVNPPAVSFGNVVTGVINTQTVQISNPSSTSVNISAANVTGTNFGISGLSLPLTLNPGQSSTFNVQFNPKSAGAAAGSLLLVSNASNAPSAISLSGMGVAAASTLSVNPSTINFGNITVGNNASRSITVTNSGNSDIAISGVGLSGTALTLTGGSAVTLSPSQSITLTVQFAPTAAVSTSGTLSIVSNATGSPATIPVSGTGVAQVQHTVTLSWNASVSATGYNVYRSATSGGGYARLNSGLDGGLTYSDASVQNSQTYFYVTTAVDSAGRESAFSSEVSVNVP